FDVDMEYAKTDPEDIWIRISITNHGDATARLHVLPTLWYRNTWSWGLGDERPMIRDRNRDSQGAETKTGTDDGATTDRATGADGDGSQAADDQPSAIDPGRWRTLDIEDRRLGHRHLYAAGDPTLLF